MDSVTFLNEIGDHLKTTVGLIIAAVLTTQIIAMILLVGVGRRGPGRFVLLISAALTFLGFCWGVLYFAQP